MAPGMKILQGQETNDDLRNLGRLYSCVENPVAGKPLGQGPGWRFGLTRLSRYEEIKYVMITQAMRPIRGEDGYNRDGAERQKRAGGRYNDIKRNVFFMKDRKYHLDRYESKNFLYDF